MAIVGIVTVMGVGLFVWGPTNPYLSVGRAGAGRAGPGDWASALLGRGGSSSSGQSTGLDGRVHDELVVTNHSFAPVRLVGVRVGPAPRADDLTLSIDRGRGIPSSVGHGESATVAVTLDARALCRIHTGGGFSYRVLVDARTASGIERTVDDDHRHVNCTQGMLPPAGSPPADPHRARIAITEAFSTAYDIEAEPGDRKASVDDPSGLIAVVGAAQSGPNAALVDDAEVHISQIVFTAPDDAAVLYHRVGRHAGYAVESVGHAREVDGVWKITRATVCADLELAGAQCPPG